ncbi:MAG: hypothetical protein ACRC0X_00530 [Brevinema sp.]
MKKQLLIIIAVLFSSCSTVPEAPSDLMGTQKYPLSLEEKAKLYPFWDIHVRGFKIDTLGKVIDINEKKRIFYLLDLMRFTINTPEFAEAVLKGNYYSTVNYTSQDGKRSIKINDKLDPKELLNTIRRHAYPVTIRKKNIGSAAGQASLGTYYLYLEEPSSKYSKNHWWIAFPDNQYWNEGGYLKDAYAAGLVFHELLHNMGFSHDSRVGNSKEEIRNLQNNFKAILDEEFYTKYQKQLDAFSPFYEQRNANELTFITTDKTPTPPAHPLSSYRSSERIDHEDDEEIICTLNEDGTYELRVVKTSNSR